MPKNITSVKYYSCGYCTNNLGIVFRGHEKEKRDFGAGVFLIKHRKHGYILFDTGYDENITKAGVVGRLYGLINPTTVSKEDTIVEQLKRDGIKTNEIKTIILSHLHPDHIGGLKHFAKSKIILSEEAMKSSRHASPLALIMKRYLPDDFETRAQVVTAQELESKDYDCLSGYDLFGDDSVVLTKLDGHARGQIGALIDGKVLLAADACWGTDLIDWTRKMKFPATMIQHDVKTYKDNMKLLNDIQKKGIRLCFSHDKYAEDKIL